jgi:ankyrin repeat protein
MIYAICGNDKNSIHNCENCNLKIIEELCKNNINLNYRTSETPIFYAISMNYTKAIEILCKYDFDINHINKDNYTALSLAINYNNAEMCYHLWKKGADINSIDNKYHTFLMTAVYNNMDYKIIEEILNAKPLIDARDIYGCTALVYAIRYSNLEIVKLLISHKASIDSVNLLGESCLMYAIAKNDIEIINLLCDNKVNINYRNNGIDAIKYANKLKYDNIVKLLKKRLNKY